MDWVRALGPGLFAAVATMLLAPVATRVALRLQAVDVPGGRKRHREATPRLGGLAIVGGIVIALLPALVLLSVPSARNMTPSEVLWFTVAVLIVFATGLADDIIGLRVLHKLLPQLLAAAILVVIGWEFTAVRLPWEGRLLVGALSPLLSVLWVVGVTNAINLIDGLDGLAAGIVAIIGSSLLVLGVLQRNPELVIAMSCVAGACLGFLHHNWRPAKSYMGDGGSLTLGFVLAATTLHSSLKASATVAILVPILALGLPVFDTLMVMWYRFLRGHPQMNRLARMFHADRRHLHHLLLETKTGWARTVFILFALVFGFCLMALLVAVSESLWLGLGFLAVEFFAVLLVRKVGLRAEALRQAQERHASLQHLAEHNLEEEAEVQGQHPILIDAEAGEAHSATE